MKNRKIELSILNVIFCLTVIMIHILAYPVSTFPEGSLKYTVVMVPWRLMSIVVQGFIMLSGVKLFLTGKDNCTYKEYLKSRFFSVIIPYIICCIGYNLYYRYFLGYWFLLPYFIINTITGHMSIHLYFIPLLVQFDLLFPLWKKIVNKLSPIVVIPVVFILSALFESYLPSVVGLFVKGELPVFNDRILTTYLSYWLIGCYIGKYYDKFTTFLKKGIIPITAVFCLATAACVYYSILAFNGYAEIPVMNEIHYVYSTSAIIFLFAVAIRIPESLVNKIPLFFTIDKLSYRVYLWHMMVILLSDIFVRDLGLAMQSLAFIFRFIFVYAGTIGLVILSVKIKKRAMEYLHSRIDFEKLKEAIKPREPKDKDKKKS